MALVAWPGRLHTHRDTDKAYVVGLYLGRDACDCSAITRYGF